MQHGGNMNNRGYQNKRPNFRHNNTRKNYHGNNNNNPNNGRDYGNHDDRGADNYNSHGSLGPPGMQHRIRNNNNPNNSSNIPRNNSSRFRNDQRNDGRFNDNRNDNMRIDNRRAGGPRPGQGGRRNAIPNKDYDDNELGWFKVTIPEGKTMTRDQILSEFHSKQVMPFVAYNFNVDMNGANFFVQGGQVVSSLRSFNKRLKSPTGESLTVRSNRTQKPSISVDDKLTEQTKIIMSRRYNVPEKALDLTNFAEDPAFKESCIFLVISRPEILGMICEIIKNNIPELVSINFCRNDIYTLQPLKTIAETCPGVKSLNISQNKIVDKKELENIKAWDLEEIFITQNPFAHFKDETQAVSTIRSFFPKILKLNDTVLPPPICFDIEDETKLPSSKGSHLPESTTDFVSKFLEQYYSLFDSADRQPLLAAYHEQALFSYSAEEHDKFKTRPIERMLSQDNRNLLRIKDEARMKTLKQGNVSVVAALRNLPKSKHESLSFLIDVPLFNDCIIQIVVNGILRFFDGKTSQVVKSFCRHFTVVPHNSGFVIINDQLAIASASPHQIKKYANSKPGQPNDATFNEMDMQSAAPNANPGAFAQAAGQNNSFTQSPSTSAGFTSGGDPANAQREMILAQFCDVTKMNRSYAHQCLSVNNYDPHRSLEIFRDVNARGEIPPEAFT